MQSHLEADRGVVRPGAAQPGAAQPGVVQPGVAQPDDRAENAGHRATVGSGLEGNGAEGIGVEGRDATRPPAFMPNGPIIRAEELAVYDDAMAVLKQARAHADWLRRSTRAVCAQRADDAYREGYDSGAMAVASRLARAEAVTARHLDALRRSLPDLVADIVEDLVGVMPDRVAVERSVRRVIEEHPAHERLTLRAEPELALELKAALADLTDRPEQEGRLSIVADPELGARRVLVWSPHASIEVSVDGQMDRLRRTLAASFAEPSTEPLVKSFAGDA